MRIDVSVLCCMFFALKLNPAGSGQMPTVIAADRPTEKADCEAKPAATGIVSGRVVHDAGNPIQGAKATLLRYDLPSGRFGHLVPFGQPTLTDHSGGYSFKNVPDGYYLIDVKRTGFARALSNRSIEKGSSNSTEAITLQSPASVVIELTDEAGNAIEGAYVRDLRFSGKNGGVRVPQMFLRDLEITIPPSDSAGRLTLADFPEGEVLRVVLDHPRFAPVKLESVKVINGDVVKAVMTPGIVLTFHRQARTDTEKIKTAVLDLRHVNFESPSTILHYEVAFDDRGTGHVTIEPGDYNFLRLQHDDFYLTPTLTADSRPEPGHPLYFEPGKDVELTFTVHRRLSAKGRVIDVETGQPVADESLLGEIVAENLAAGERDQTQMNFTDWADTDAKGEFTLPVAAGRMRVEFHGNNRISETDYVEFEAAEDGSTVIPDIKVRSLPKVTGVIRNPDGTPAKDVVVRFRGDLVISKAIGDPVLTDDQGRFELQPKFVVKNDKTHQRQLDYSILAFDAYRPLAARIEIRLDKPEPLELTLEPHGYDWPLTEFSDGMSDWERGIVTPERAEEDLKVTLRGRPIPDLDCAAWINSDRLDWESLRGKYVLLDFWFIGCGPCHAEFPVVKMLHQLYHDKGLVVIGVHSNENPPDKVRDHVKEIGLPYPIAVDHPDGRTVSKFQSHKLVHGFPSYVLIDPHGNVLLDDRTIPHPSLRGYKLEIIRNALFGTAAPIPTR